MENTTSSQVHYRIRLINRRRNQDNDSDQPSESHVSEKMMSRNHPVSQKNRATSHNTKDCIGPGRHQRGSVVATALKHCSSPLPDHLCALLTCSLPISALQRGLSSAKELFLEAIRRKIQRRRWQSQCGFGVLSHDSYTMHPRFGALSATRQNRVGQLSMIGA